MLRAIESKQDVTAAITKAGNLADFVRSLADVETLTAPDMTGNKADLIGRYATIRLFAPELLDTFTFHGGGSSAGLLKAVALIGHFYRTGKRALPATIRRASSNARGGSLFSKMGRSIGRPTNSVY